MTNIHHLTAILAGALALAGSAAAQPPAPPSDGRHVERYPDGRVKLKASYRAGVLDGAYVRYHPNGKVALKARYDRGKLDGKRVKKDARGRTVEVAGFKDGLRHGPWVVRDGKRLVRDEVWIEGVLAYPRSRRQIARALARLERLPAKGDAEQALRRLNVFRYACGVPADVVLDAELSKCAKAGAELCDRIGHLDHTPKNPGLPDKEYQYAYQGTSKSNLHSGSDLLRSVDGYMDDSDPSNVDRVGHRRWCLNPWLNKVGFGAGIKHCAMLVIGPKRAELPDYDLIAYPGQGYFPCRLFERRAAWHVSPNPRKYTIPAGAKVAVYPLPGGRLKTLKRRGRPLPLSDVRISREGMADGPAIIFRVKDAVVRPGARYWVEVAGLTTPDGKPTPFGYVVEFTR